MSITNKFWAIFLSGSLVSLVHLQNRFQPFTHLAQNGYFIHPGLRAGRGDVNPADLLNAPGVVLARAPPAVTNAKRPALCLPALKPHRHRTCPTNIERTCIRTPG
ncbi:hypothetical protein B0H17DRAFT_593749 [Mycena rosella]|uniref:Secreted protein n=1 Tax=Mycena rosella TaxID=1033263 RepID=A0AAD7DFM6_MYCRO|nr:hypothetical protein B0H17DRAFT_593749 [Mycena rosella]